MPIRTDIPVTTTLYAWTSNNTTYYTESETPAVGDILYTATGEDSGKRVTAVSSGTITWND